MGLIFIRIHILIFSFDEYSASYDFTGILNVFLMEHYSGPFFQEFEITNSDQLKIVSRSKYEKMFLGF